MKTSQLKSLFAFLLLAAVTFTSCKKDDPTPSQPIVGSWIGKYGTGNNDPSTDYRFNILPNGVLQVKTSSNEILGAGTWKLDGETFTGVYTYLLGGTYNLAAKYDQAAGELNGSWGEGEANASLGEFYLNQQ